MKRYQVWLILGGILIIIGINLVYAAAYGRQAETFTIPAGEEWYVRYEINLPQGGQLSGTFTETSQRTIDFYVFDEGQFATYSQMGAAPSLLARTGSRGDFSVSVPHPGKYYMVFDHGAGNEGSEQRVSVSFRVLGLDPTLLAIGVVFIVAGASLVVVGVRAKRKVPIPAAPAPSDVVMFDEGKPPS